MTALEIAQAALQESITQMIRLQALVKKLEEAQAVVAAAPFA